MAYSGKYVTFNMPLSMTLNKTVIGHFSDDLFLTKKAVVANFSAYRAQTLSLGNGLATWD